MTTSCAYSLLRNVFGSIMQNATGHGKMLHNEKSHDLHFPPKGNMDGAYDMYGGEDR